MKTSGPADSEKGYMHVKIWDRWIRWWHWLLVFSVTSGWLLGEYRTFSIMQWHIYCGYLTGLLLLFRIWLGFFGSSAVRFSALAVTPGRILDYTRTLFKRKPSAAPGHNPLGAISVIVMLIVLAAQVITGLFAEDDGLFYSGPFASTVSGSTVIKMTALHHYFSRLVLILVLLHVAAVIFYLLWKKENLIRPMLTGKKIVKRPFAGEDQN